MVPMADAPFCFPGNLFIALLLLVFWLSTYSTLPDWSLEYAPMRTETIIFVGKSMGAH